jgi:hypothetical protein
MQEASLFLACSFSKEEPCLSHLLFISAFNYLDKRFRVDPTPSLRHVASLRDLPPDTHSFQEHELKYKGRVSDSQALHAAHHDFNSR